MKDSVISIIQGAITVALIAVATRWVFAAKGAESPRTTGASSIYAIKRQFRAVGLATVVFSLVVSIWSWHDLRRPYWTLIGISVVFVVIGIWIGTGVVTTDQEGITKKVLWSSHSLGWNEITEVRFHRKQGGAIELRSGKQKLIVDSRFNAFQYLLREVEDHTKLPVVTD
jgi:hypothetical protein